MDSRLTFETGDLPDDLRADLIRELCDELERDAGVSCAAADARPLGPGRRGEPITLGAIAIAALASPVLVEVCRILHAFASRDRSFVIDLARQDGRTLRFEGSNLSMPTRDALEAFVRDAIREDAS